jgi:anti-anti-sigma factor
MTPKLPRLVVQAAGDTTVVRFADSKVALDDHTVVLLRDQFVALAEGVGPGTLLLDFGNVEFLSSRMLGTLITLCLRLKRTGRHLVVCNVAPVLYEAFDVTRLTRLLDVRRPGLPQAVRPG